MCGIVGRTGSGNSVPYVLTGLTRLEYRGYDSAGLAALGDAGLCIIKSPGRLEALKVKTQREKPSGNTAIGHTRWATHGEPNEVNAHPQVSRGGRFAVVHNGIIENYRELKKLLPGGGAELESQTDTEVAASLLESMYTGDAVQTISKVTALISGTYAFGIICTDYPDTLFCTAKSSPLVVCANGKESFLASDAGVLTEYCKHAYRITNGDICVLSCGEIQFFDNDGVPKEIEPFEITSDSALTDKGGYPHYMLLEITEQPESVRRTLAPLITDGQLNLDELLRGGEFTFSEIERVVCVACGSAYNAGLVGKTLFESLARLSCSAEIASEFRYSEPIITKNTLAIFISQSGETADTLAALRLAKEKGARVLSIVNVRGSAIAEESDLVIYTRAGRETAVATTKAYSAQLAVLSALAFYAAHSRGEISLKRYTELVKGLSELPEKIYATLQRTESQTRELAEKLSRSDDIFFLGRQLAYASAAEGSLKMKEISYIHSEAYPAGELKHGTIALIEQGTPVVALLSDEETARKTLSNLSEVKSRGAKVYAIMPERMKKTVSELDGVITVPDALTELSASLLVVPLQLTSYYTALARGCDIDKPKNLAKSVTVE